MRYLIVTSRSLLWFLCSLIATLCMLTALLSPSWLVGPEKFAVYENETIPYSASVGVYTRCNKPSGEERRSPSCTTLAARGLATDSKVFPNFWKASTIFISLGITMMCVTVIGGLMSCCFQRVFKKSIFVVTGVTQVLAGMSYIIGVMLHPMDWNSVRVLALCGNTASPFYPAECSIGLGMQLAAVGTVLTFVSACLSVPASKSTNSDKVQDKINDGHTLVCIP